MIDGSQKRICRSRGLNFRVCMLLKGAAMNFASDFEPLSSAEAPYGELLNNIGFGIGLYINRRKTKVFWINTMITEPVRLDDDLLEEVNSFTYLGSVVDIQGGHGS